MGTEGGAEDDVRTRALALLEATHRFPCEYEITVIAFNTDPITAAVRNEIWVAKADVTTEGGTDAKPDASADADLNAEMDMGGDGARRETGDEGGRGYQTRASRAGKYLSHRFSVRVRAAVDVLDLHARLRAVVGVVTIL